MWTLNNHRMIVNFQDDPKSPSFDAKVIVTRIYKDTGEVAGTHVMTPVQAKDFWNGLLQGDYVQA